MGKFNLSKFAQSNPMVFNNPTMEGALESSQEPQALESELSSDPIEGQENSGLLMSPDKMEIDSDIDTISVPVFDNHVEMYEKIKSMSTGDIKSSMDATWNNYFASSIGNTEIADDFKTGLNQFFESDPASEEAVDIANKLYDLYSKIHPPKSKEDFKDISKEKEIDIATASTMDVVKLAQTLANKNINKSKSFNLTKIAQHKGIDSSVILTGPGQTSLSPFTRDVQGGLHLIEQNKGFGLKIDDILDIDFEAIWRGNIMDKYNQPYRDEKGNYVGGYINRRFEVDRNIPVGNNLQLLPGTRHRPWMPEYSTLESRMEVSRGNRDKLQDPFTFSKLSVGPFNLKKKNK